ncbi:hypothetical protein [Tropicimonas sp. IMCC34011]|uniref:hypothetical protein n=1 Tax=Tropicimonas sp. IMCC34011 TaxID=2248759 RepID=UPI001300189B|nr:hypothetical protein [Tropicimonas sp. IMCC34011]
MTYRPLAATALCLLALSPAQSLAQSAAPQGTTPSVPTSVELPDVCRMGYVAIESVEDAVSADAVREAARAHFAAMDQDDSGTVGREEAVACLTATAAARPAPADRSDLNVSDADLDGDGVITRAEYFEAARAAFEAARNSDLASQEVVVLRRFIFDPTGRSIANPADLAPDDAMASAARMFDALDADGDGIVSTGEWAGQAPQRDVEAVVTAHFDELDADGSGDLSEGEVEDAAVAALERARRMAAEDGVGSQTEDPPIVYYRYASGF